MDEIGLLLAHVQQLVHLMSGSLEMATECTSVITTLSHHSVAMDHKNMSIIQVANY